MPTAEQTPDQQKAKIGEIVEEICDLVVRRSGGDGLVMSMAFANAMAWLSKHALQANGQAGLEDWIQQMFSTTLGVIELATGIRLAVTTDAVALTRATQAERAAAIAAVNDIPSIGRGVKETVVRAISMRPA